MASLAALLANHTYVSLTADGTWKKTRPTGYVLQCRHNKRRKAKEQEVTFSRKLHASVQYAIWRFCLKSASLLLCCCVLCAQQQSFPIYVIGWNCTKSSQGSTTWRPMAPLYHNSREIQHLLYYLQLCCWQCPLLLPIMLDKDESQGSSSSKGCALQSKCYVSFSCSELSHICAFALYHGWHVWGARTACWLGRRTHDQKIASWNPSRSSRRIFFSRVNFVCWLIRCPFRPCVTAVAHKRPCSPARSAGGRLHLNMQAPLTQQSWSGLTMPPSRHSVGTYQETSSHATHQGTLSHSCLSSLSHCGLILT